MIERILELMSKKGITAKKLTEDIGISSSAISEWKKGKAKPTSEAIIKMAKYFNVTTDYILLGIDNNSDLSNEEKKLLEIFQKLSADDRIILIGEALKLYKTYRSEKEMLYVAAKGNSFSILPDDKLIDKDIERAKKHKIGTL